MIPSKFLEQRLETHIRRLETNPAAVLDTQLKLHPKDIQLFFLEFAPWNIISPPNLLDPTQLEAYGVRWQFVADLNTHPQLEAPPSGSDFWNLQPLSHI